MMIRSWSESFGGPAAKAARMRQTEQEPVKYAESLDVHPSLRVRADGTALVGESDEFFSHEKWRVAFLQKLLNDPDIRENLCRLTRIWTSTRSVQLAHSQRAFR
jgi:hypothetical protein